MLNFFGDRPLGPWPDKFTLVEDIGCLPTLIGFLVFLAVIAVLQHFLF